MQNPLQPFGQLAGVVLCGGQSRRMGVPKYRLPFGEETLLQRICRIVAGVANPVVVAGSAGQELTEIRRPIHLVRDAVPDQGPLQGLLAGLMAIDSRPVQPDLLKAQPGTVVTAAFVTSCDLPLLSPSVIRLLATALKDDCDAVFIDHENRRHPLCAVYRIRPAVQQTEQLLASGERRMIALANALNARTLPADDLRSIDPDLDCLLNCNTPDEYQHALRKLSACGDHDRGN